MQIQTLLALASLLSGVIAQASSCIQGTNCKACGWYCNQGCSAPLVQTECNRCLYCRRESSSCGFMDISDTWTHDPPSEELCAACNAGCWCHGDWYCMDNATGPPPMSPPTSTRSAGAARATIVY